MRYPWRMSPFYYRHCTPSTYRFSIRHRVALLPTISIVSLLWLVFQTSADIIITGTSSLHVTMLNLLTSAAVRATSCRSFPLLVPLALPYRLSQNRFAHLPRHAWCYSDRSLRHDLRSWRHVLVPLQSYDEPLRYVRIPHWENLHQRTSCVIVLRVYLRSVALTQKRDVNGDRRFRYRLCWTLYSRAER